MREEGLVIKAIVAVDVVDSSAFLSEHGVEATIASNNVVNGIVVSSTSQGEILDHRGDGTVVAFGSVADALVAAWSMQQKLAQHDEIALRSVVTLADVDANGHLSPSSERRVAELETQCAPSEILVDQHVVQSVRGVAGFTFEPSPTYEPLHRLVGVAANASLPSLTLQAVLITDTTADDGTTTGAAMARQMSERCITEHGGTVVDSNGAGSLAFFSTCAAALEAADALHLAAKANALRSDVQTVFEFGAGVSVGDVVNDDGRVYGTAVVEAARLLELAKRGSSDTTATTAAHTLITDTVATIADSTTSTSIGSHGLKGLPDRVEIRRTDQPDVAAMPLPSPLAREATFPLVGRADERRQLDQLWTKTNAGNVCAAVVTGEEGVGKTRLVRELAHAAHATGAIVLHGGCDDELRIPYGPVLSALNQVATIDDEIADSATTGDGPIGQLLRSASGAESQNPAESNSVENQPELFDAVAVGLRRVSVVRPVLVVIDDIQWADSDTIGLIQRLFTHGEPGRLAIIATCRAEDLDRDAEARQLLLTERADQAISHIRLGRLNEADVSSMLATLGPGTSETGTQEVAATLTNVTGGSPLYVEELINHLVDNSQLVRDQQGNWSLTTEHELQLPDSVVELMARRAQRLSEEAFEALSVAAVIGTAFDLEVLARALDRTLVDVLDIIDEAVVARLVVESATGECSFRDELAREALLRDMRPSKRALVHQQIATTLEELRPREIDLLAAHWSASIGTDARAKAIHYLRLAGDRDMGAAAWESSVNRHQRILELLAVDAADERATAEVHYALGSSFRKLGRPEYRPELLHAATIARKMGDGSLLAECATAMMRPGAWYPEAAVVDTDIVDMCQDALLLLDDNDKRARVLAALAVNLTYGATVDERTAMINEAQDLAEQSGDLRLQGTTLAAELITFHEPGRMVRRRELADHVRLIGRATGDGDLLFVGSWFVVLDLISQGEVEEAQQLVAELTTLVEATQEYWPSFLVSHFATAMAIARCEPDASALIDEEYARFLDQPVDSFGVAVIQQAAMAVANGTLSNMLLSLVEAADEHDSPEWAKKWNYALSRAYLDDGDTEAALAAIAINPDPVPDYYWLSSVYHLGLLGLMLEDTEICEDVLRKLSPFRGRFAIIGLGACFAGQISTALGHAQLGLGNLDEAEELFREAMVQADNAGFPFFATHARRFLCETLFKRDPSNSEARQLLDIATTDARTFGFALEIEALAALADRVNTPVHTIAAEDGDR